MIPREPDQACADEPIRTIGTVQPHGFLLVVDIPSMRIVQVSSGAARAWKGSRASSGLLNGALADWVAGLPQDAAAMLQHLPTSDPAALALQPWDFSQGPGIAVEGTAAPGLECVGHRVAELAVLEWQSGDTKDARLLGDEECLLEVAASLARLRLAKGREEFFEQCVQEVANISGFDRVMLYRFLPDWSGEVVAELASANLETRFLGLRFPASDIPAQARALYAQSRIRVLADVAAVPDTLVPALLADGRPLDQSHSVLRGYSETHLGYLRNMGVRASMSLSIMLDGRLWGMLACHHDSPRRPPHRVRQALRQVCELLGGIYAMRIESLAEAAVAAEAAELNRVLIEFNRVVRQDTDTAAVLARMLPQLLGAFQASALCIRIGELAYVGVQTGSQVGTADLLQDVAARLAQHPTGLAQYSDLLATGPGLIPSLPLAAGLLGASLSPGALDFCAVTRPEVPREVHWAGKPDKTVISEADGRVHLEPRRSFEPWKEDVLGTSRPWSAADVESCKRLLGMLNYACTRNRDRRL